MKKILMPIDGSLDSDRALDRLVARLEPRTQVGVVLLYVHEPPLSFGAVAVYQDRAALREFRARRAHDVLEAAAHRLREAGIAVEARTAPGPLYRVIASEAERLGADEIVLGVRPPAAGRLGLAWAGGLRDLIDDLPPHVTIVS
jgi:nucleotide-binding universal stress UspA family protein